MTAERQCTRRTKKCDERPSFVMAGLVPAIHVFAVARPQDVDARDKRGHDDGETVHEENQEVRRETLIRHGRT